MSPLIPLHGGCPRGRSIRHDLSTNANQLGPCPSVLAEVRAADFSKYPDPEYRELRAALAARHEVSPERVVVGAGASELILRLVRRHAGPVRVLGPSFSEYARCARLEERAYSEITDPATFAATQRSDDGIGFACWPNNPTGDAWPHALIAEAARRGLLAVDLAYAPFCSDHARAHSEKAATNAYRLYSPNKTFGLTGLRAAYLIMPRPDERLPWLGASWSVDAAGVRFLHATLTPEADAWLAACRPVLQERRSHFAEQLRIDGIEVRESPANFLLARLGDPSLVVPALEERGVALRDATSFGLRGWFRLAAPLADAAAEVLAAILAARAEAQAAYSAAR